MFAKERQGYITLIGLLKDVVTDMKANGFTQIFPADGNFPTGTKPKLVFETSATTNAFHTEQPWRVAFEIMDTIPTDPAMTEPLMLATYVGTQHQIQDDGTIVRPLYRRESATPVLLKEPMGTIGSPWTVQPESAAKNVFLPNPTKEGEGFYCRYMLGGLAQGGTHPMSYMISITSRGFFLGIWQNDSVETGKGFHWMLVQRSVDKDSGKIRGTYTETLDSRCPVFCVHSTANRVYKTIVREKDIEGPSFRTDTTVDVEDHPAMLNPETQVSFNEDGDYVITLLNNLTTTRFRYTDELDMVGTISADVIGGTQEIKVKVYGEAQDRTYRALIANKANNTGMRILVLVSNPNET